MASSAVAAHASVIIAGANHHWLSFPDNDRDQAARTKGNPMSETQDECSPGSHCYAVDQLQHVVQALPIVVERFEFMKSLKIEKVEDIVFNIEELKKGGHVPNEIVSKVLELAGVGRTRVNNGEIGIAGMYDQMHYQAIIETISKNPNCFEKTKERGQKIK